MLGQQVGHLLGEDLPEQCFQFAVGAFGLLLLQPAQGVVFGQQVDLDRIARFPEGRDLQDRRPAQAAVSEQQVFTKAGAVAAGDTINRSAGQFCADRLELWLGDGERHKACSGWQQGMAELASDLITKTSSAQGRDRQAAGSDHQ
ncbi:hypothetical protein D3C81_904580 [compost metagenome]